MATLLSIKALEGEHKGDVIQAGYNTGFVLDRTAVWQRRPNKAAGDLEFERVEPRHLSIELLFEAMSSGPIQPALDKLQRLASVDAVLHRPPKVEVSWGSAAHAIPSFEGVVESISVRYVGGVDDGVPLHAAVELELREATHLSTHAA